MTAASSAKAAAATAQMVKAAILASDLPEPVLDAITQALLEGGCGVVERLLEDQGGTADA
jgi:hypothetical protein